ncbi:response regulator [bacterium]|nr:MAG: response regulator [bacterium]
MIAKVSKRILIADDSVFFRTRLSDIFVEAGHRVRFAKDGQEVINEIKLNPNGIDLLVLDIQMPHVDGFGVLKWINENGFKGKFPVLAVTGVYEPVDVMNRLKRLGASGLVTKGFTPEQMIFRVNNILFPERSVEGAPRLRVPVSLPADFTVGDITRTGYILNISETGVFLHTKTDFLTGTNMLLKFSVPGSDKVISAKCVVKWTTVEVASQTLFGGSGIMFNSLSEDGQRIVREFVEAERKRLGMDESVE